MTRKRYQKATLALLLMVGAYLMASLYYSSLYGGERWSIVSVAGFFPQTVLQSRTALWVCGSAYCLFGLLWLLDRFLPWSSWLATASFTLHMSIYLENLPYWDHQMNLANQILLVLCAAQHFSDEQGQWPEWTFPLCRFTIAIGYMWAGVSKILASGFGWADGLTLQLLIIAAGESENSLSQAILQHRELARFLQSGVLALELSMPLTLYFRFHQCLAGLGIVCFHLVSMVIFDYINFLGNAILVLALLVVSPVFEQKWANPTKNENS